MSRTVKIPNDGMNPFVVIHNGIKYVYKPGETVTVPDGVALEIEEHERWDEKYFPEEPPRIHAQPDLSQNDPTAADYVKNRTHYEETTVVNEPLNITWDGNTEGLLCVDGCLYKVSDIVLTDEQLKTITETRHSGNVITYGNWEDWVASGCVTEDGAYLDSAYIRKAGATIDGATFPETGIYLFNGGDGGDYTASITTTEPVEYTKTVVHKLDKKFLPKATTLYVVDSRLYHDEECTRKVSAAELDDMIFFGGVLLNEDGYLYFPFVYEYDAKYGSAISYTTYEDGIHHALTLEVDNT